MFALLTLLSAYSQAYTIFIESWATIDNDIAADPGSTASTNYADNLAAGKKGFFYKGVASAWGSVTSPLGPIPAGLIGRISGNKIVRITFLVREDYVGEGPSIPNQLNVQHKRHGAEQIKVKLDALSGSSTVHSLSHITMGSFYGLTSLSHTIGSSASLQDVTMNKPKTGISLVRTTSDSTSVLAYAFTDGRGRKHYRCTSDLVTDTVESKVDIQMRAFVAGKVGTASSKTTGYIVLDVVPF